MNGLVPAERLGRLAFSRGASLPAIAAALVVVNLIFTVVANAAFRLSAHGATWRAVLGWQVVGNLAGLVTVLTLTGLLRYAPLSVAFPMTTGLGILGVQIVAADWWFHESIRAVQWLGAALIIVGILLVNR